MPHNHLSLRPPRQHMNHLIAPHPIVMIPRQPALRMAGLVVLPYVILIAREDPGPGLEQVHLQDAEAGGVPRRMANREALCDFEKITLFEKIKTCEPLTTIFSAFHTA